MQYILENPEIKKKIQNNMKKSLKLALNFFGLHFSDNSVFYPKIHRSNDYWDRYAELVKFVFFNYN